MDVERFRIDLASNHVVEVFGADLERARAAAPDRHEPGAGRVPLPSLEFLGPGGEVHGVYGPCLDPQACRAAALAAGAAARREPPPDVESALRRLGRLATPEVAAVCRLPGPRAAAELWRLAAEWKVRPERYLTGELWSPA